MGRKEDVVKLAEKLMYNKLNIRNIGIVAHIDHGKCVWSKARIPLVNGRILTAEELFVFASLNGKKVVEDPEKTVYALEKSLLVNSLNKSTGVIEAKPISHAWKLKGGKLLKFTLRNNLEIATTPEHKFVLFNGIDFIEKPAMDLKTGDRIACAKQVLIEPSTNVKENILTGLSAKQFYVLLNKEFFNALKERIIAYGISRIASQAGIDVKPKSFYHGLWKGRIKLSHLIAISNILDIELERIYDEINFIYYRGKSKNSIPIKLPENLQNLFYLAGLFFGDGSNNRFVVGKKELGEKFLSICNELGFKPWSRNYPGKTPEFAVNKSVVYLLNALFDYPLQKKSHNIRVSEFLQLMPNQLVSSLLQAYFDCDGTVEENRRAISITSVSKQMLSDLQLLLLRFGCASILNEKKQTLYITGESTKAFNKTIGFGLKEKKLKAEALAERIIGSSVLDCVPINGLKEKRLSAKQSMNSINKHYYKYENEVYLPVKSTYKKLMQVMLQKTSMNQKNIDMLSFIEVKAIEEINEAVVYDFSVPESHTFIAESMCIHNTTLSDNLVAASGIINPELAGKVQFMDYYELEQERGITINAANISLVHNYQGNDYLINLIDTPGHVDFGGEVIRAMRAVDGAVIVVDAVEGTMPQTETVIRQALREWVKPVLFINKIDRLVNELQLTPQQMQEKFVKVVSQVNNLIKKNAPEQFKEEWLVKVQDASVCFGSAKGNWGLSALTIKETGIGFKEVYELCKKENGQKELAKKSPVHKAMLEMVIKHLPNPVVAQKYRTPVIWKGELESEEGKAMLSCNEKEPFVMMVTDVGVDPHAGDVATGRIYAGTAKKGLNVRLIGSQKNVQVSQVAVMMGAERVTVTEIPAGNIAGLIGLKDVWAGETISSKEEMHRFESFMSAVEPVMTVSVEAKNPKDLPKLIEVIRKITKEDPNVRATINQETGEHLLSGMGELHLEITQYRIEVDNKLAIKVGNPIVVFHESVSQESPEVEGKSPNKHNKFKITVEPLSKEMIEKLVEAKIDARIRLKDKEILQKLEEIGFTKDQAKNIWAIHNNCVLLNTTKGIQYLNETKELVIQSFEDATDQGPLAQEKCSGLLVSLNDATLHEDAVHRGPAQVLPAVTRAILACILLAGPILREPKQILTITVPQDFMGNALNELAQRRTHIQEMRQEGDLSIIIGKAPVNELIGFSATMRGATQGRAVWTAEYSGYENMPLELQIQTVKEIRKRKGLPEALRKAEDFMD